jgi:hypothetical protein
LWRDLASGDACRAAPARWAMVAGARQSVPFLAGRLRPPALPAETAKRIARLIAELNDDEFQVRERASRELAKLGGAAVRPLRQALQETSSPEVRHRLRRLLEAREAEGGPPPPEQLRLLRAVRVLEQVDTSEGRQALEALAQEAPEGRLLEEVRAALGRLRPGAGGASRSGR